MSYPSDAAPAAAFLAESRVSQYLVSCIAPLAVSTVFVLARIYTRAVILRLWGIDDTLITISWVGSAILTILDCMLTRYGAGKHIQTLTLADIQPQDILAYTVRLIYQLVLSGTKLGICFFYLRVFSDRNSRYIIFGLIAFIVLFTIPLILVQIFQCKPVTDAWAIFDANCPVDELTIVYVTGAFNICGDTFLLAFVVPKIWPLRMPVRQKLALMAILTTSLLVIIAAIIRTRLVAELTDNTDPSWNDVIIALWSVIEVNTGLFCVSVVAIRPLVLKAFPGLLSTTSQSSNTYGPGVASSAYRAGTKVHNRGNGLEAFELQSAHDKDSKFGAKVTDTNNFWVGRGDMPQGYNESETYVLGGHAREMYITKTVDVVTVIESRETFLDVDQSSDSSMKRFEPV